MKIMKYLAVACLGCLAACSNYENAGVATEQQPADVVVSLRTARLETRAAMGDLQDKVEDRAEATLEKVHVYLVNRVGSILESHEFIKDDADWKQLLSSTPIASGGGYRFTKHSAEVDKAVVICNPQNTLVAPGGKVSEVAAYVLKSQIGEVVYADEKRVTGMSTADSEPLYGAEFTLKGNMNRFQILGTKFYTIGWTEGGQEAANKWQEEYKKEHPEKSNDALNDFIASVGVYKADGSFTKEEEWKKYFQIIDVTKENTGIVMNHFYYNFNVSDRTSDKLVLVQTYADGGYDFNDGTFKKDGMDLSAAASYYNANGFDFADNKVVAFNFFSDKVNNYGKDGDAPYLHFIFKTGGRVSEKHRFFNITGYTDVENGDNALDGNANKYGKLLNLDLSKLNGGHGILVEVDSTLPQGVAPVPLGSDDFVNKKMDISVQSLGFNER